MTSPATSCAFLGIGFRETWPPRNTEVQPFAVADLCARAVSPLRMRRLQESRPGSWFRRPSCGFHGRRNGRRSAGHGACLRKSGVIHSCRVQIPGTCMAQVSRTCDRLAPYRRSVMTPRASCSPLWRQPPEQSHHPAAAIPLRNITWLWLVVTGGEGLLAGAASVGFLVALDGTTAWHDDLL